MRVPRRRRCAATSMNGIESMRACWFITNPAANAMSARDLARPARCGGHAALQAAHRDLKARDALGAADGRRLALADRLDEGEQFGAQRLGVAGRQMAHRI